MHDAVLGIDAGGTAVKAVLCSPDGRQLGAGGETLPPVRPAPGHNERDPAAFWAATCRSIRVAITQAGISPGQIAAIAPTGYGNGLWLVDTAGDPVGNGILSSDLRATGIVQSWQTGGREPEHVRLTCQNLWPGKPAPLLAWMMAQEPDRLRRARHLLFCKDYLRLRLTGTVGIEPTDLSSSSLADHAGRGVNTAVLDLLGLGPLRRLIPDIRDPLGIVGHVSAAAAAQTGLIAGTPVAAGVSDNAALMIGAAATEPEQVLVVAGTWGLNQRIVRHPVMDGTILATLLGARPGDLIAVDGGPTSASTFEWFVNTVMKAAGHSGGDAYAACDAMVAATDPRAAALHFLPYLDGSIEQPEARGAFIGLSSWHGVPHMARAVFEGVAFEHRRSVERLMGGAALPATMRFAGGAARSAPWRRIFAAVLGTTLVMPQTGEIGALGAAVVAACAVGLHPSLEQAVAAMCRPGPSEPCDADLSPIVASRYETYGRLRALLAQAWRPSGPDLSRPSAPSGRRWPRPA